jgi:tyrosinase
MGEKLKDFNIKDNDGKPWSKTTATSRYGITESKDKKTFKGLEGVNNAWKANQVMGDMRKHWYDPTGRRKKPAGEASAETADDQSEDEVEADSTFLNPGSLADSVNRLFCPEYTPHWEQFASTKWYNEGSFDTFTGFLSLEYIHNNVHNIVGGSDFINGLGHMSDVPVAAFDPIFWLHHCQVDRLFAIWQCLYPERWWDLTKTTAHDAKRVPDDTEKDKLYPFHNKDLGNPEKDVWTAELCRDWTGLNYQYDDIWAVSQTALKGDGQLDEEKFKIKLHDYINDRYPHTGRLVSAIRKGQKKTPDGLAPVDGHFRSDEDKEWSDYIINVIYDRYALNGASYSIEFYLGGPSDEDKTVFHPRNLVGHVYNFGGGVRDTCSNCKSQESAGVLSRAQVPITIPLLHHAVDNIDDHPLDNYVNDDVAEYLKLHLRWRFVRLGGEVVNASKFPKTQVKVLRGVGRPRQPQDLAASVSVSLSVVKSFSALTTIDMPAESHMPVYSRYVALPDVTQGKPWGLQETSSEGDRYF